MLRLGLPVGCEFLDPITPQYIADTVAGAAIGARTTESQIHRQLGAGLSMPVGFKNRTDGNVQVAVDAVRAAAAPHAFAGVDDSGTPAILHTAGNPDGHVILRGGTGAPNHDPAGVAARAGEAARRRSCRARRHRRLARQQRQGPPAQPARRRARSARRSPPAAARSSASCSSPSSSPGARTLRRPRADYGQSITDACMDWDATVGVLDGLAAAARDRRA